MLREKDRETDGDSQKERERTETEGTALRPWTEVGIEGRGILLPNSPQGPLIGGWNGNRSQVLLHPQGG